MQAHQQRPPSTRWISGVLGLTGSAIESITDPISRENRAVAEVTPDVLGENLRLILRTEDSQNGVVSRLVVLHDPYFGDHAITVPRGGDRNPDLESPPCGETPVDRGGTLPKVRFHDFAISLGCHGVGTGGAH